MPSFDVVSEIDMQEVKNAVDQAQREVGNRFDFKGTLRGDRLEGTYRGPGGVRGAWSMQREGPDAGR